jgi:hypothetical protein
MCRYGLLHLHSTGERTVGSVDGPRTKVSGVDDRFAELSAEADGLMEPHSIPGLAIGMIVGGEEHTATFGNMRGPNRRGR